MEETLLNLWRFVNYKTEVPEFERWVYETSELEEHLPSDLYFLLISTPYKDKNEIGNFATLCMSGWRNNLCPALVSHGANTSFYLFQENVLG
jgi:hypothetical protein